MSTTPKTTATRRLPRMRADQRAAAEEYLKDLKVAQKKFWDLTLKVEILTGVNIDLTEDLSVYNLSLLRRARSCE